jgi:hypothetical protein
MPSTTDYIAIPTCTASYSWTIKQPVASPTPPPCKKFKPVRIKRDFMDDWYGAIYGALQDIRGDAPPKRLKSLQRNLVRKLRVVLKDFPVKPTDD